MNTKLAEQIRVLVDQVNLTTVPSGVLPWWGCLQLPNGKKRAATLNQIQFEAAYERLTMAALTPGWLSPLQALKAELQLAPLDGPIPLAVACIPYARPRHSLRRALNKAANANQPLANCPTKLSDAVVDDMAFMAGPVLAQQWATPIPTIRSPVFELIVDRRYYLASPTSPLPNAMRIDVGNGMTPVHFGDRVLCSASGNTLTAELQALYGNKWYSAHFTLAIDATALVSRPDDVWQLTAANGVSGQGFVYRGNNSNLERRYVLMSEGFPGGYPAHYSYDNLNQFGFADALRAAGRDVVVISMNNGLLSIQENAELIIAAIKKASETGRGHVVGGVSMGGMTTRFALTAMEERGQPHHCDVYLCIDSPHGGSQTSPSVQWFAQKFAGRVPFMDSFVTQLQSPANQQFLPRWLHNGKLMQSPLRTALYNELELMGGYPQQCKRYAVASGSGTGKTQLPANELLLSWDDGPFAGAELTSQGSKGANSLVASGGWHFLGGKSDALHTASTISWEGVAGSVDDYTGIAASALGSLGMGKVKLGSATACVVPTVSALDMNLSPLEAIPPISTGDSPFDDYCFASSNLPHIAFEKTTSEWMLNKILSYNATSE